MTATATSLDDAQQAVGQLRQVIQETFSTLIVLVLDQSGSMGSVRDQTIQGLNEFIAEQRKTPGKAYVSLTVFDTRPEVRETGIDLDKFPTLTRDDYRPSGGTALFDAVGMTVESTEKWIADRTAPPTRVLFVIITDGAENSSTDFTSDQIAKLIDKKQEQNWDFAYLGANQDAILAAKTMHIRQDYAANYDASKQGTTRAFGAVGQSVSTYRSKGGKIGSFFDGDDV